MVLVQQVQYPANRSSSSVWEIFFSLLESRPSYLRFNSHYLRKGTLFTSWIPDFTTNHNYNKILRSDWLSTTLRTVRAITRALNWLFFTALKKNWHFFCFDLKKEPSISQILLKVWLIGNRTSCRPIRSVIILVIKLIGLPLLVWLGLLYYYTRNFCNLIFLRAVVFQLNLKYLHVKITNPLWVVV